MSPKVHSIFLTETREQSLDMGDLKVVRFWWLSDDPSLILPQFLPQCITDDSSSLTVISRWQHYNAKGIRQTFKMAAQSG